MKLEPSRWSPANSARALVSALEITDLVALTMVFAAALSGSLSCDHQTDRVPPR